MSKNSISVDILVRAESRGREVHYLTIMLSIVRQPTKVYFLMLLTYNTYTCSLCSSCVEFLLQHYRYKKLPEKYIGTAPDKLPVLLTLKKYLLYSVQSQFSQNTEDLKCYLFRTRKFAQMHWYSYHHRHKVKVSRKYPGFRFITMKKSAIVLEHLFSLGFFSI